MYLFLIAVCGKRVKRSFQQRNNRAIGVGIFYFVEFTSRAFPEILEYE